MNYPEARQLLLSILDYMNSNEFQPEQELDLVDLNKVFNAIEYHKDIN
jgi:hypothetical protein